MTHFWPKEIGSDKSRFLLPVVFMRTNLTGLFGFFALNRITQSTRSISDKSSRLTKHSFKGQVVSQTRNNSITTFNMLHHFSVAKFKKICLDYRYVFVVNDSCSKGARCTHNYFHPSAHNLVVVTQATSLLHHLHQPQELSSSFSPNNSLGITPYISVLNAVNFAYANYF